MEFDLEYNSERPNMIIPEYGRHIQKLIDHCIQLEDREERNRLAKAIVNVMGNVQPHLRDVPDFKHKLWDQLYIMSNFQLDVDSPYKIPSKVDIQKKPEKLPYPKTASKYRYYGHNMQTMIYVAMSWDEGELKNTLIRAIANHMKKCYLLWNKDNVTDTVIANHLKELSHNKLTIDVEKEPLLSAQILKKGHSKQRGKKNNKKKR